MLFEKCEKLSLEEKEEKVNLDCIFSIVISNAEEFIPNAQQILSKEEIAYFETAATERKHSFLLGRVALLNALSKESYKPFPRVYYGCFGFPILPGSHHNLSLSHSGKVGVCILFPPFLKIGIDIEVITETTKSMDLSTICLHTEVHLSNSFSHSKDIFKLALWTIKEALSKALQTGLNISLEILEIDKIIPVESSKYKVVFKYFSCFEGILWVFKDIVLAMVIPDKYTLKSTQLVFDIIENACITIKEDSSMLFVSKANYSS